MPDARLICDYRSNHIEVITVTESNKTYFLLEATGIDNHPVTSPQLIFAPLQLLSTTSSVADRSPSR